MKDKEHIVSVNNRLIINENSIDLARVWIGDIIIDELYNLLGDKFDDIGLEICFDDECCDDECSHFCFVINIILLNNNSEIKDDDILGVITYSTNDKEPNLVYIDGEFRFYYVFEQTYNTCTNPFDMKNTFSSEYPCEKCLEQILIDTLDECLKQE